jgi:hypothetical protein
MFRELIELGVVEIDTEPLDARIELTNSARRLLVNTAPASGPVSLWPMTP